MPKRTDVTSVFSTATGAGELNRENAIAVREGPEFAALSGMPHYQPQGVVSGTIRIWGHGSYTIDFMRRLVTRWEQGFAKYQPSVNFDYRMYGSASSIGALYAGTGDLAIKGEEIFPYEIAAYEKVMHYTPQSVTIATGSLDVRNFEFAQMFFVNRENPISKITLTQLDAIFGTEHRRGAPKNFRVWGDVGLTGAWADKPIHLYGWSYENDFWIYLQHAIFGGSHRLSNSLHEYAHIHNADGTIYDAGQQVLEGVAADPYAIGISNLRYLNPQVKPLALAETEGASYVEATKISLISQRYPLTGTIPAVFNRAPGQAIDPKVKEFLRYILSREGQEDIAIDGEYLPLNAQAVREELRKLD